MPFISVNNHQLHYTDSHPDGAPAGGLTFFFIHGLGSSQNYYFPVLPFLTPKHRCITADTYGSGRSPYTDQSVSIGSIAVDVIGILDALNVPQAVVVGHSMGGLVVTLLGSEHADRVKGIVAIGPTHPTETLHSVMSKRSETAAQGKIFRRKAEITANNNRRHGVTGEQHSIPGYWIRSLPSSSFVHPRTRPRTEPEGICGAMPGHRQRAHY